MAGILRDKSPRAGDGGTEKSPDWHIDRPSTAKRMEAINENAGFIAQQTNLTTVLRGFHFKADRAERRRAWHVSEKWKQRHIKKKPWKVGEVSIDVHKDYSHLKHAPSPESQKIYRASTPIAEGRGNELATVPEEDPGLETEAEEWAQGASAEELLEAMNETNVDDLLNESEEPVEEVDIVYKKSEFYDENPIYNPVFQGYKGKESGPWHDVTGLPMLKHDDNGNLNEERPPTVAESVASEESDGQHQNLIKYLVDDRFKKTKFQQGETPMTEGQGKSKALRKRKKDRYKSPLGPLHLPPPKPLSKALSEEQQRMEQNRILRQMTEEEFQRETERRMMIATIANPRKRLLLHQYFEEQRAIAAKKLSAMVAACEHAVLQDMGLTKGPDQRGPNFKSTYKKPAYFPELDEGQLVHDPYALTPSQEAKLRDIKRRAKRNSFQLGDID